MAGEKWSHVDVHSVPRIVVPPPGPASQAMHTRAAQHMKGYSSQVRLFPVAFQSGRGVTLNDDEKVRACRLAEEAGAHFVKTSTGFVPGGATVADVKFMRASVGPTVGVKAAGGIRDLEAVLAMLAAGATRIGVSQTKAILQGFEVRR